jgi:hypothetical protein
MRYLVQFIVPALIFVGVVYLLGRRRREAGSRRDAEAPAGGSDVMAVLAILTLGAAVAIATALALGNLWN